MDHQDTPPYAGEIAIAIVVRSVGDSIDGTIALADGPPVRFSGWMQLTQLMSRAVNRAG